MITLAVLFVAGVRWTHFALLGAVLAAAVTAVLVIAPAVGHPVLQGYQQERLTSFLQPSDDPRDASYQINQALIADRLRRQDRTRRRRDSDRERLPARSDTRTSSSPSSASASASSEPRSYCPSTPC